MPTSMTSRCAILSSSGAALWDFAKVKASQRGEPVIVDADKMPGAKFFPDARLNYAENLLVKSDDDTPR